MNSLMAPSVSTNREGWKLDAAAANAALEPLDSIDQLRWGLDTFGESFALTTSFGIQSAVLLHMASRLSTSIPVIWVDTGYLTAETYRYAQELGELLPIRLEVAQAEMSPARMEALHGRLWETGQPDDMERYLQLRKVQPLDQAFERLQIRCWASGVRGNQTDHRSSMNVLDAVRGRWSLRPLLAWTARDVFYYMQENFLPQHPLFAQGYSSVGDWHSSGPDLGGGDNEAGTRASRFGGLKQECGIHLPGVMGEGI
ncbi:phosphoadenylyl-sulfate reductase [Synechococcus sp. Tobar12-5m-g]|nr:phosphoadenylyl-sulfate reductase [Synechococcus sp. Tobar12-5m-g]MCP9873450.1 phosphoadenylyl-sulfate reductase [Synechococcus sp. Cruz CV-v-12]